MDQLHIKNLEIFAFHGVFPSEKELGQKFILNVTISYDMTKSATTKDLTASIHYGELCQHLTKWATQSKEDLIETLAHHLINHIFQTYPIAHAVELEIKKPWAPVHLPLETCSITLKRRKQTAFIGLGTNQGDKEKNLAVARKEMEAAGLILKKTSSLLETEPWGGVEQDSFLNQVVQIETWQTPDTLMTTLLAIENKMGRIREIKWGPRLIDLDILFIEDLILYTENLILPHPYVTERRFVLDSLVEIAPHFIHPIYKQSIRQILENLEDE